MTSFIEWLLVSPWYGLFATALCGCVAYLSWMEGIVGGGLMGLLTVASAAATVGRFRWRYGNGGPMR